MKKKGRPNIPDFSRKRPARPTPHENKPQAPTRAAAPGPIGKPQSTSAKSGRRGSWRCALRGSRRGIEPDRSPRSTLSPRKENAYLRPRSVCSVAKNPALGSMSADDSTSQVCSIFFARANV